MKASVKRIGILFMSVLCLTINVGAQNDTIHLYVGQSMIIEKVGLTPEDIDWISWTSLSENISCIGNGFQATITPTCFFSGCGYVKCEWRFKAGLPGSQTYYIACIDNPVTVYTTNMTLQLSDGNNSKQLSYSHANSTYASFAKISFECNPVGVVEVSETGLVTAKKEGTTIISVLSNLSSNKNPPSCAVTVTPPPPTIDLPGSMTLGVGQSKKIIPIQAPGEGYTLSWRSRNPAIATVDSTGLVTAKSVGTVQITASIVGTNQSDNCVVTVKYILLGDVNDDGKVNIADVAALIDLLLYGGSFYEAAADMNQDDRVNIADLAALIDYLINGSELKGDVNDDGRVNIADVSTLIDYLLNATTSINRQNADMNSDGRINIADVSALIDYLLTGNSASYMLNIDKIRADRLNLVV